MMLLCERAPCDGHIATGIDGSWHRSSSILDDNPYGTGVLANGADLAYVQLPSLSIGELRADPEPVFGSSASQQVPSLGGMSSVARCPVAPVVARGGAVLRAGAGAVVVELFASVSWASSSATRLLSIVIWSFFCSSVSCFCSSATCFLSTLVC